jgi:uncharacterized membrane protein YhhN
LIVVCAAACAALLWAERRGWHAEKWIFKPAASLAFVVAALAADAHQHAWGQAVVAALALCVLGDVLLIPKRTFLLGLGAFLAGHVVFCAAFLVRGVAWWSVAVAAVPLAGIAIVVGRWLLPHVDARMQAPVLAYMTVITAMVALAAGTVAAHGRPLLGVAAFGFYLSDLSVARDRFVAPGFVNRAWGLPLYYAAQLVFAVTASP